MAEPMKPALVTGKSAGNSLNALGKNKGAPNYYGQTRDCPKQCWLPEQFFHIGNSLTKPNVNLLTYCFFLG